MYNGYGSGSFGEALEERERGYLGRNYCALDLGYEISPLLFGEVLFLKNWSDDSYSVSFRVFRVR